MRRLDLQRGLTVERSPGWRRVERAFLALHPACAACDRTKRLEVHHILPYHMYPHLELDPANLMTLCRRCHELVGHLDNWQSYNKDARADAGALLRKVWARP